MSRDHTVTDNFQTKKRLLVKFRYAAAAPFPIRFGLYSTWRSMPLDCFLASTPLVCLCPLWLNASRQPLD